MKKININDSLSTGLLVGLVLIILPTLLFKAIDWIYIQNFNTSLFKKEAMPLTILAINIIVFRFLMVKWNLQEVGKGLFLILFLAVLLYFTNQKFQII
jgi:hypothetical protein